MLKPRIREVFRSNLCRDTGYADWSSPWFSSIPRGKFHDRFLVSPFHFIVHHPLNRRYMVSILKALLTLSSPVVTICTTCFNTLKLSILPSQCIYVFRMVLTINSNSFLKPVGLCSGEVMFPVRYELNLYIIGTRNSVFKTLNARTPHRTFLSPESGSVLQIMVVSMT
jgi:hypothetical protein